MRKVKYHCAASLDGLVARVDGSFDCFAMEGPHVVEFFESLSQFGVALMGRKTYDVGLRLGVTNPYPFLDSYVFSRTMRESPDPAVKLVSGDAVEHVRALKQTPGKDIWLAGAGSLAATLFAADLVDEVIVKLNPLLIGDGVKMVDGLPRPQTLKFRESKVYDNGVVLLTYEVPSAAG
jgi:dihydrofolate reductase